MIKSGCAPCVTLLNHQAIRARMVTIRRKRYDVGPKKFAFVYRHNYFNLVFHSICVVTVLFTDIVLLITFVNG